MTATILDLPNTMALVGPTRSGKTMELIELAKGYLALGKRVCCIEVRDEGAGAMNRATPSLIHAAKDEISVAECIATVDDYPEPHDLLFLSIPMEAIKANRLEEVYFNLFILQSIMKDYDVFLIDEAPYTLKGIIDGDSNSNMNIKDFIQYFKRCEKRVVVAIQVKPHQSPIFDAVIDIRVNEFLGDYKNEIGKWIKCFGTPILVQATGKGIIVLQGAAGEHLQMVEKAAEIADVELPNNISFISPKQPAEGYNPFLAYHHAISSNNKDSQESGIFIGTPISELGNRIRMTDKLESDLSEAECQDNYELADILQKFRDESAQKITELQQHNQLYHLMLNLNEALNDAEPYFRSQMAYVLGRANQRLESLPVQERTIDNFKLCVKYIESEVPAQYAHALHRSIDAYMKNMV